MKASAKPTCPVLERKPHGLFSCGRGLAPGHLHCVKHERLASKLRRVPGTTILIEEGAE